MIGKRLMVNEQGYLCRANTSVKQGVRYLRDWWIGKEHLNVMISSLPNRYHGKHIRIKIEIVEDEDEQRSSCLDCGDELSKAELDNKEDTCYPCQKGNGGD